MIPGRRAGVLLLLPSLLLLAVLYYLPQLLMLGVSLATRTPHGGVSPSLTLANYARALEPLYLGIFARSVVLASVTTLSCLLLGYPVAYWLARRAPRRWRGLLVALVILPFWTSFLVRMYAWIVLLRSEGVLNLALAGLGLPPLELLYNDFAVLLGQLYGELPFMILPLYASLEKLDLSLLEASADLGAPRRSTFWRVTVPMTMPGIVAGIVLVFVPSLGQFIVSDLLGGAKTILAGNLIQNQFAVARNKPFGAAIAFELTAAVLLLLFVYALYTKRKGQDVLL
jgi:spermidine/putrescine transport system permease protein